MSDEAPKRYKDPDPVIELLAESGRKIIKARAAVDQELEQHRNRVNTLLEQRRQLDEDQVLLEKAIEKLRKQ